MATRQIDILDIDQANKYDASTIYWKIKNARCIGKVIKVGHSFNFKLNDYWTTEELQKEKASEMFTAEDAKNMFKSKINEQLTDILDEIKKVAGDSRYLNYYKPIAPEVRMKLHRLKFKVYNGTSQREGIYYRIDW